MCQRKDVVSALEKIEKEKRKTQQSIKNKGKDFDKIKKEIAEFSRKKEEIIDEIVEATTDAPKNTFEYKNSKERICRIINSSSNFI